MRGHTCQRQLCPTERLPCLVCFYTFDNIKKISVSGSFLLFFVSFLSFFPVVSIVTYSCYACLSVTASLTALLGHTLSGQGRTVSFIVNIDDSMVVQAK